MGLVAGGQKRANGINIDDGGRGVHSRAENEENKKEKRKKETKRSGDVCNSEDLTIEKNVFNMCNMRFEND